MIFSDLFVGGSGLSYGEELVGVVYAQYETAEETRHPKENALKVGHEVDRCVRNREDGPPGAVTQRNCEDVNPGRMRVGDGITVSRADDSG
jgi:hypothetical protein